MRFRKPICRGKKNSDRTHTLIVLATHGMIPTDYPAKKRAEYFKTRSAALEAEIRAWPRNARNDPYRTSSLELARALSGTAGCPVITAFVEFCQPSVKEALAQAVLAGAQKIIVVTPMLTRGGNHAEKDIPHAIARARRAHRGVRIEYAWPFGLKRVAGLLAHQIKLPPRAFKQF